MSSGTDEFVVVVELAIPNRFALFSITSGSPDVGVLGAVPNLCARFSNFDLSFGSDSPPDADKPNR